MKQNMTKRKKTERKKKGSKLNDGIVARKCKVGRGSRKHSSLDLNKKSHGNEVLNAEENSDVFFEGFVRRSLVKMRKYAW